MLDRLGFPRHGANENVERLRLCIECEGCYRVDRKYHVSAVVGQKLFAGAIGTSNASHAAVLTTREANGPHYTFHQEFVSNMCGVGIDFELVGSQCRPIPIHPSFPFFTDVVLHLIER